MVRTSEPFRVHNEHVEEGSNSSRITKSSSRWLIHKADSTLQLSDRTVRRSYLEAALISPRLSSNCVRSL
ncbi:hypothetical protein CRENBAI_006829 [Crenichthys baileyi]|uniref:Uncharacterized protein n=1 Tax=Crenichthys baileyi TaxID=28760 RepID=A0AAV9R8Y6_9TELE